MAIGLYKRQLSEFSPVLARSCHAEQKVLTSSFKYKFCQISLITFITNEFSRIENLVIKLVSLSKRLRIETILIMGSTSHFIWRSQLSFLPKSVIMKNKMNQSSLLVRSKRSVRQRNNSTWVWNDLDRKLIALLSRSGEASGLGLPMSSLLLRVGQNHTLSVSHRIQRALCFHYSIPLGYV